MGSDESHFNVLLIVRDKVTRQCPQTTKLEGKKGEPKLNRTEVLLLTSLRPYRLANRLTFHTIISYSSLNVIKAAVHDKVWLTVSCIVLDDYDRNPVCVHIIRLHKKN